MPEKGNALRFWVNLSRPIVRKMYAVLLLQALFGTYLSSKHYDIYLKMLKIPDSDSEEIHDWLLTLEIKIHYLLMSFPKLYKFLFCGTQYLKECW